MKIFIFLTFLFACVSLAVAQKIKQASSPLQSMVDTERAFARMAEEQGVRPSFMAFLAEDGILFRPTAVKGKQWMTENPLPASDKRPLLSWRPTFADIAGAGDMGYTTGPWEFKTDIKDAKPVAFGNFLTVWKKQGDGSWKFAIDLGISNPQPAQTTVIIWQPPTIFRRAMAGRRVDVGEETAVLLAREREFSNASATRGAQIAFDAYAADEVRVFRNNQQPLIGKKAAARALPVSPVVWSWDPAFADVSQSGDLGYSYGTYEITERNSAPKTPKMPQKVEAGNYYRIWKKLGREWKVVADLLDPVPAR